MFPSILRLGLIVMLVGVTAGTAVAQQPPGVIVRILDAGPGDATWITSTAGNHQILVNCGPPSYGRKLVGVLQAANIQQIDALVVTDAHADHIGGCPDVIQDFPVRKLLSAGYTDNGAAWKAFAAASANTQPMDWSFGQQQAWDDGITATVLNPTAPKLSAADDGDALALEIDYTGFRMVFADGDGQVAANGLSGPILLLHEGNHASTATVTSGLLSSIQPQLVVLSYSNLRGEAGPDRTVVDSLRSLVPIGHFYSTPEKGTIAIVVSTGAGPDGYAVYTDH